MNTNIKNENPFSASMVLDSYSDAFTESNLKYINTSFIKRHFKNKAIIKEIEKKDIDKRKPLFIGFASFSGNNRAQKAIELALSTPLFNNLIIENVKTILLHISSDSIELNIDEIGKINDIIRQRIGNNAAIIMSVGEDKNLEKSLSITIMVSEFDAPKKKS
jgi:cell division GTPase FtsZ